MILEWFIEAYCCWWTRLATWQIKCVTEEVRLHNEVSFPFSPDRTMPFWKIRLMVSFQRSSYSSFLHECYLIIEKMATFSLQMLSLSWRNLMSPGKLILVLLISKGDIMMIIINKNFSLIFRLIMWFANRISCCFQYH